MQRLDDCRLPSCATVGVLLDFLLDHMPASLHLVIAWREVDTNFRR